MRRPAAVALLTVVAVLLLGGGRAGAQDATQPPPKVDTTTPTTTPGQETFGGKYPPDAYTVRGVSDVAHPDQTFYSTSARGLFDMSRQLNTLGMAATLWTWKYDLTQTFTPIVQTMADVTQQKVVWRFGLVHFALVLLGVYVGVLLLKGRLVHGVGEFAMSAVCMIAAGWIALHPVAFFTGATSLMREVSTAVSAGDAGRDGDQAITGTLHQGLIHDPWEWLSFGHVIDGTKCEDAADVALAPKTGGGGGIVDKAKDAAGRVVDAAVTGVVGPGTQVVEDAASAAANLQFKSGTDGAVSKKLDDLGCPVEKAAYENPSGTKIFGAFMLLLASIVVNALSLTVDIAVIVAQAVFALLAVTAPLAVVAAVLPGKGRDVWWAWLSAGAKAFVAAVAGCYLLAVVSGFIGGVLTVGPANSVPMELRMTMIVAIPVVAWFFRKKIVGGATRMGGHGVARAGALAPSANATALHAVTAGSGAAVLGMMGADPAYSLRQQGRNMAAAGQHALHSRKGQLAVAAATGGVSAAATAGGALRGVAMRTATRVAWAQAGRPGQPAAEPDPDPMLELPTVAGRTRPVLALDAGPQGQFTMPARPGDAPARAGYLPAADGPAGALNPGPGPAPKRATNRRVRGGDERYDRRREAQEWPAGYPVETGPARPDVVYHPDPQSARVGNLRGVGRAEWDQLAEHRLLRVHERFHAEGRDRPLTLDEIAPTMRPAHRRRVRDLSAELWQDEAVATHLAGLGVLRIGGASAEERHWLRNADFTRASEMTKLRGYQTDGRLRIRGEGPVPAGEALHRHAASVFEGRPIPLR